MTTKERSPRGVYIRGYEEEFERYKKENLLTQAEAILKLGITYSIHVRARDGQRVDVVNAQKLKLAGLSIIIER